MSEQEKIQTADDRPQMANRSQKMTGWRKDMA